jgi:hypothetical protein
MGDVEVARSPAPVTAERESARRREADALQPVVEDVLARSEFAWVHELSAWVLARGPLSPLGDGS